jgi:hypothetical protein
MFVEQMNINTENNPFNQFALEFLSLLEKAKYWVTVDHLISVIESKDSLKHMIDGLEESEVKQKLSNIAEYDTTFYSKIVASLLPKLHEIKQ